MVTSLSGHSIEIILSEYNRTLTSFLNEAGGGKVLFANIGNLNEGKTEHIMKLLEQSVIDEGDKRQTMKRLSSLVVEMTQNIAQHGSTDKHGYMHSYLIVGRFDNMYKICTGNLISSEDEPTLTARIDELNALDKNAIRKLYIETLCNDEFSYKGGAGLGLLTIAKRSVGQVQHQFIHLGEQHLYFTLNVNMQVD
ncbi:MAG: SiaB family protein kinase [Flavobacteriales bacterium]